MYLDLNFNLLISKTISRLNSIKADFKTEPHVLNSLQAIGFLYWSYGSMFLLEISDY